MCEHSKQPSRPVGEKGIEARGCGYNTATSGSLV
jgi:hypothetical protein